MEWESRFILGLNAAKNADYMKNGSNKNCSELISLQKSNWTHISISPEVELGSSKDWHRT